MAFEDMIKKWTEEAKQINEEIKLRQMPPPKEVIYKWIVPGIGAFNHSVSERREATRQAKSLVGIEIQRLEGNYRKELEPIENGINEMKRAIERRNGEIYLIADQMYSQMSKLLSIDKALEPVVIRLKQYYDHLEEIDAKIIAIQQEQPNFGIDQDSWKELIEYSGSQKLEKERAKLRKELEKEINRISKLKIFGLYDMEKLDELEKERDVIYEAIGKEQDNISKWEQKKNQLYHDLVREENEKLEHGVDRARKAAMERLKAEVKLHYLRHFDEGRKKVEPKEKTPVQSELESAQLYIKGQVSIKNQQYLERTEQGIKEVPANNKRELERVEKLIYSPSKKPEAIHLVEQFLLNPQHTQGQQYTQEEIEKYIKEERGRHWWSRKPTELQTKLGDKYREFRKVREKQDSVNEYAGYNVGQHVLSFGISKLLEYKRKKDLEKFAGKYQLKQ